MSIDLNLERRQMGQHFGEQFSGDQFEPEKENEKAEHNQSDSSESEQVGKDGKTEPASEGNEGIKPEQPVADEEEQAELLRQIAEFPAIVTVLGRVLRALEMAEHFGRDRWDFAIELQQLLDLGAPSHVVRMLVCNGWIKHQRELPSRTERKFAPESEVVLQPDSCFVLTTKGHPLAKIAMQNFPQQPVNHLYCRPIWDRDEREFRIDDKVVKRFRWKAVNQEKVLDAFAEANWPTRIDNPLPIDESICPKQRLHDTIKCLNRKHVTQGLMKFRGDGTGQGVILEITAAKDLDRPKS